MFIKLQNIFISNKCSFFLLSIHLRKKFFDCSNAYKYHNVFADFYDTYTFL